MKSKFIYNQQGISLVVSFLIMTIILAVVLSISTFLFSEITIIRNISDTVSAFNSSETGIEKTFYIDRKQIPSGGTRGFCSLCTSCSPSECTECTTTDLDASGVDGCSATSCTNCLITYTAEFDELTENPKTYSVYATVTPDPQSPGDSLFTIKSKGFYKQTSRAIEINAVSASGAPSPP
ncbi:MAG: pilus assembly PilX N-terminal domain-containing protein [bacterium]|nr:pilus assembly PilX N-terminal domain-containing protein [bacterium]